MNENCLYLTIQDIESLLQKMKELDRKVQIDWTNQTIRILSEEITHPTKMLSTGPMTYREILHSL